MPKIDSYSLDTAITDTDSLLGVNAADGKTKRYTMSAIKTALLAGADITAVTAGTGLSGGGDSGAVTLTIDATVTTLTGSQTLTNKTLTAPIISSISNSGTLTLPTSSDTLVGRATTDTLTNKTLTSPSIATPTWTATESAIANGDYLLFLDASASSETKKEGLDDIATLFAGTGLTASNSVIGVDASQTQITSVGTITTGTWQASLVGIDYGGTGLSGETDGMIVIADGSGAATHLDVGSSTGITILGTIATGVWQGTAIDTAYLDTTLTSQTSILNSSLVVGYGTSHANIDFSTDNSIIFDIDGTSQIQLDDGVLKPTTDSDVDLGTSSLYFKNSYIDTVTTTGNITVGGNLSITGDLTVSGDTTTVNTATLSVEDPLIIVGSGNNSSDSVDLGLYGLYDTSGSQDLYSGLFRDASDSGKWKLFKSLQTAPTTTVNTSGTGYAVDTLVANIEGNVTGNVTGNTSGTAATVTGAAQSNITSLGTLTGLDVNGAVTINDNLSLDGSNKELRFYEGSNYVGFEAPALSGDQIWILPSADGTSGTALKTDGSGNLSWGTAGGNVFKTISVSGQSDIVADGVEDTLTIVGGTGTTVTTNAGTDTITINAGANTVEVDEYTGNGSTAQYTLSTACTNENNLLVYMDGVYQHHNTYSVSSATLTFDTNVPNGSKVEAYHMISVNISDMVQSAVAGTLMDVSSGTGNVTFNVDLTEAGEAAIANGDYILFLDGGATGTHAKEAIADVATLFAGAGLTASSSVMAVGAGTGITVNANDVAITAAQTGITSVVNSSLEIGRDADNRIKFGTDNQIIFEVDGGDNVIFKASGEIEASSLDISGDADIDGTLEADAITVAGTALNEYIADTVGAMVGSNTETGISVTYEDGDNTLDFVLGTITSLGTISTGVWQGTAIASAYIAGDAITGAKIADDAIDSEHYTDGSIDTAHLAADAVTGAKIADDAIDSEHYTDGSIDTAHIADLNVTTAKIAADAITGAKIADDAVNSEHYTDGSIDTAHIADNNITHDKLENRYTVLSALGTGGSQTLDFSAATTFTATMNGNATFTITNPKQGQVVDLILAGNHTPTLAMSGATFNKVGTTDYDGGETNLIQILCADDSASEIFYYSVAKITSDTTP